ncbi:chorismate synthase [Desulfothermus okinawensis JCM 13304]
MSGNTFGKVFRLTTFGESHGIGLGGVLDGCPPGIELSVEDIQAELNKRRPGAHLGSTTRKEKDRVEILSGVFEGYTTGTPIGFFIKNEDQRPKDYSQIKDIFRPGHADFTYEAKYGIRDYRGGGRASGRETVSRVVGGAIAQKFLKTKGIEFLSYTKELGGIAAEVIAPQTAEELPFFAPDPSVIDLWKERVEDVKKQGDSIGGIVEVQVIGVPPGLGEPVFDKLDARLAYAVMSIGAVKAVEIGSGFDAAHLTGSQNNDYITKEGFTSNNAGGILGGISSGQPIVLRAAIKPIPSISIPQKTINKRGQEVSLEIKGRHDVSAIPRIVPVIKAMVALTIADMYLLQFGYEKAEL